VKKNYTLCFYEYPGALMEIKQWESLKFNAIIKKEIWLDKTRVYEIQLDKEKCDGYEVEVLICIAMDDLNFDSKTISSILEVLNNLGADYFKTIVFGKVDCKWLNRINKIVTRLEG
jgi:hypothetical protein